MEEERKPCPMPEIFQRHFLPKYPLLYEAVMRLPSSFEKPRVTVKVNNLSTALRYWGLWAPSVEGEHFWLCVYYLALEELSTDQKEAAMLYGLAKVKPGAFYLPEYALFRREQCKSKTAKSNDRCWYLEYFSEYAKSTPYSTGRRIILPTRKETKA